MNPLGLSSVRRLTTAEKLYIYVLNNSMEEVNRRFPKLCGSGSIPGFGRIEVEAPEMRVDGVDHALAVAEAIGCTFRPNAGSMGSGSMGSESLNLMTLTRLIPSGARPGARRSRTLRARPMVRAMSSPSHTSARSGCPANGVTL